MNVNGLNNKLNYPEFVDYVSTFDIFGLSETHLDSTDIVDINNYTFIAKNRSVNYKRKSGGIGLYVKDSLAPFIDVVPNSSEYVLWVSIDKTFLQLEQILILGTLYVPPDNSRFFTDHQFTLLENEIFEKCSENKYVYLAGDKNCRVGSMRDFVFADIYINETFDIDQDLQSELHRYTVLEDFSFNLNRKSKDNRTNTNGFKLLDICKNNNLFILNGRSSNDKDVGESLLETNPFWTTSLPLQTVFEISPILKLSRLTHFFLTVIALYYGKLKLKSPSPL